MEQKELSRHSVMGVCLCVSVNPEGNSKPPRVDRMEGENKETAANNSCTNWPVHCVTKKVQFSRFRFKTLALLLSSCDMSSLQSLWRPGWLLCSCSFPTIRLQTLRSLVQIHTGPQRLPGTLIRWCWKTGRPVQISPPLRNLPWYDGRTNVK